MRADARRNRDKLLAAARAALNEPGAAASMAEISRRAGVGMATLYRNFPTREDLLEALYKEEVDGVVAFADELADEEPGAALERWLRRFLAFIESKHPIAGQLLTDTDQSARPMMDRSRDRVVAAGRPLLDRARAAGRVRADLELEQILDLVLAVGKIPGDAAYREPILAATFAGLAPPAG